MGFVLQLDHLAICLGCGRGLLPFSYLERLLGGPYKCMKSWNPVIASPKRLGKLEGIVIIKRWELTLIKFVLASLLMHFMSIFVIPTSVTKISKGFLWVGRHENLVYHLVSFDVVCRTKKEGVLGIMWIGVVNKALPSK